MILKYLTDLWRAITPGIANHLWQSTLFAVVAGLLAMALRKNQARVRYWLWLAASVKFLIPFALLVTIGSHLPWARGPAEAKAGLYFAMEEVSQPFGQPMMPAASKAAPAHSNVLSGAPHFFWGILAAVWLCGFALVLFVWCRRWGQISRAMQEAVRLQEGREVEALRRAEQRGGIRKPIQMFLSRGSLEPGVFGITRPALLWPEGISDRLDAQHLGTILAHEVSHVRRRDNLAAAIHMAVEAIFWFYPLVWWLGTKLVEERERACDEEVLQLGSEPHVYAESILKTCEFCLESPLACVSGVTGADLKKRIVRIMTERAAEKLRFSKKVLLSLAGLLAIAVPVVFGRVHAAPTRADSQVQSTSEKVLVYEVASIKPNKSGTNMVRLMFTPDGLSATNGTLQMLINAAYGVEPNQVSGAPSWANTDRYDVEAKMDSSTIDDLRKLNEDDRRVARQHMLQALLAERFKLTLHRETKELPIYELVVAKDGPRFHEAKPGDTYPNGIKGPDGQSHGGTMFMGPEGFTAQGIPISNFVQHLKRQLGRNVVDKTGLTGKYDFTLKWTPDESQGAMFKRAEGGQPGAEATSTPESSGPSIFTAIQEQLGLKMESQKGPVEIYVIDHAEKPSED